MFVILKHEREVILNLLPSLILFHILITRNNLLSEQKSAVFIHQILQQLFINQI